MSEAARISSSIADRGLVRSMVSSTGSDDLASADSFVSDVEAAADLVGAEVSLQTEMRDPLRFRIFRILSGTRSVASPIDGVPGRDPDASEFDSLFTAAVRSAEPDLATRCGLVMRQ